MAARRVAFRAFWARQRRLTISRIAGAPLYAQKTRKDDHTYHPIMIEGTSGLHRLKCTHTTALRGFRLGARRALVCVHHKRRATTSGSLATPPFGLLFPSPRGVGKAFRWAAIACASPPAEETGKAIVWVQFN